MTEDAKIIGGFRVLKDLKAGAGSQGTVYQAVCEKPCFPALAVGEVVALKVMAVQDDDGAAFARLEKRTAELSQMKHPGVVRYYGCFREQGAFNDVHVIVLEFVEGRSLKDLLESSPCGLGTEETMRITGGLIGALAYTSGRGIVHRDIKPGNIIIQQDGTPKLIDFEVARREDGTLTMGGSNMIGTFDYMAPDFMAPDFRGDVTSDVFSMGVCLHEMLTGRTPYRRHSGTSSQANVAFLQRWISAGSAPNPLRVSSRVGKLLVGMRDVLERALAPDREQRLKDFVAFGEAMEKVRYREIAHNGHAWRLLNYIGHGGFGEVFAASDLKTGARVAVKRLLNAAGLDRFRREAHAMRRVAGSCFTNFIDWFTADEGSAFLVMDYLDGMPGSSLKDALSSAAGQSLSHETVLTAFIRYAHGLADLHGLGLVHRDIKPSNLYFPAKKPAHAVIMDLGIARDVSGTATVGQVPGTIDYMPPECVTGKTRGGPEADVWALGLCLYEALTGQTAYARLPDGVAAYETYFKRVRDNARPDFSGLPDDSGLLDLLKDMCAVSPDKRLRDMRQVERRLRILNGEKPDLLPVPADGFVWKAAAEDADFADGENAESESGVTMATVCGSEAMLSQLRADYARSSRPYGRRLAVISILLLIVLLGAGGVFSWRYAERRRREELVEAANRARIVAEEAHRKAELERRKAEAERIAREKNEVERLAREKAEAERLAREKEAEAERLQRERAEAQRLERERKESKRKAIARAAEEAKKAKERQQAARKAAEKEKERADAERRAREAKECEQRAQAERVRKDREERLARERKVQIDKLDTAFQGYTQQYQAKLDEALRPGSRIDPVKLQQDWLIKKRAYLAARKKLEK